MNWNFVILLHKTILSSMILDIISNLKKKNRFFKQFTAWNLLNMVFEPKCNLVIMNNIIIFILFHSCFILQPELISIIPKKCKLSVRNFHICNIISHILPVFYSIYMIYVNKIVFNIEDILDNIAFNICWQIYIEFDYSLYSVSKQYYFNLYIIYICCLGGLLLI